MFYRFIGDGFVGQIAYHVSGHRLFSYEEEHINYSIPKKYLDKETEINEDSSCSSISTDDDLIIIGWEDFSVLENPKNWPFKYKALIMLEVSFLELVIYLNSAIYTPGIDELMQDLNISYVVAVLPLTLFVIGYGLGPMVFSPMSENPMFGRTSIYVVTLFIYCILQIPIALSKSITSLTILRFFSGIFASPALATGGASIADIFAPQYLPYALAVWGVCAFAGMAMGPFFGAIFVVKAGWRWTFWFPLIVGGGGAF